MIWGAVDKREGLLMSGEFFNVVRFAEGLRKHFLREVDVVPLGDFDFDFDEEQEEGGFDPYRPFHIEEYGYDYRNKIMAYRRAK